MSEGSEMVRTVIDQAVEQIAAIIAGNIEGWAQSNDKAYTLADARRTNNGYGWGFDVRWIDEEYVSDKDCTRVQRYRLSETDIERAYALAQSWVTEQQATR